MSGTQLQELAAAQALGALDHADEAPLRTVVAHDASARSEIASFHDTAASLAQALSDPARPSPELRAKILDRVCGHAQEKPPATAPAVPAGFRLVVNGPTDWQSTPLPGLRVKPLSVSRDMGY